jgi:hypothetical protein
MVEDALLKQARALYKDRIRIVLSLILIAFTATFYILYSGRIDSLIPRDPFAPDTGGWTAGFSVIASFNTFGFLIAIALMAAGYKFWTWAFLPSPATTYTLAVLQGIFGDRVNIKQILGKRFRVTLEDNSGFDIRCRIHDRGAEEWFLYRLTSIQFETENLHNIALRHGFGVKNGRFVATVSNDELHHRTILLAKALTLASTN